MLVAPYLKPQNGKGDAPPLPYYLYTFVGIGIMVSAVAYWFIWIHVIPWFGWDVMGRKERLKDGTVVTLVRPRLFHSLPMKHTNEIVLPIISSRSRSASERFLAAVFCLFFHSLSLLYVRLDGSYRAPPLLRAKKSTGRCHHHRLGLV